MITKKIKTEQEHNPQVIFPYGKIEPAVLENELQKFEYSFPTELIQFWTEFGGGDLFQNETILSPIPAENEYIYDLSTINNFHYGQGLSQKYIIFQENASEMTAFDKETNEVVLMTKEENKVEKKFPNINQWFDYLCAMYE